MGLNILFRIWKLGDESFPKPCDGGPCLSEHTRRQRSLVMCSFFFRVSISFWLFEISRRKTAYPSSTTLQISDTAALANTSIIEAICVWTSTRLDIFSTCTSTKTSCSLISAVECKHTLGGITQTFPVEHPKYQNKSTRFPLKNGASNGDRGKKPKLPVH